MSAPKLSRELAAQAAEAYRAHNFVQKDAAIALGLERTTFQNRLERAAEYGLLLDHPAAMPGFRVKRVSSGPKGTFVTQTPDAGGAFEMPGTHRLGKITVNRDADGNVIQDWIRAEPDALQREATLRAVVDALKEEIPRTKPVKAPRAGNENLLNQYTITDSHFGMLAWREETGADYDLKTAEQLLLDWFAAAIDLAPNARVGIFAQLGDFLHHDSHQSVTPTNAHVLDADSRLPKIIRVVIRVVRQIIALLLAKHEQVHIIMADANHDPAAGVWLREMLAAFYEHEPRITVDSSASTFYAYEFGQTSLFYHHGHKRKLNTIDGVLVGKFREIFGRTKYSYAHLGHLHSDELRSMPTTMKVERHETLAAPDAYAANGGWLSGRSAKVITYHREFGEVGRSIITPEMLAAS